jgi:hypothetical protein
LTARPTASFTEQIRHHPLWCEPRDIVRKGQIQLITDLGDLIAFVLLDIDKEDPLQYRFTDLFKCSNTASINASKMQNSSPISAMNRT